MAEPTPTMAAFLQGLGPRWTPPFGGAMPQSDEEREHLSWRSAMPYLSMLLPPVATYQGAQDIFRGWDEGSPSTMAHGAGQVALSMWPVPVLRAAGRRSPSAPPAAPAPTGPWQPGYMNQWLQGRYQPAARPQAWQPDRRWGSLGNEAPSFTWRDVVAGRIRAPQNRAEMIEAAKGAGAAGAAGGVGGAAGMYLTDRLYHERPWQDASWRALMGPSAGDPPSWWPQPPPDERPLPPSGPMPPSQLRSGW